MLTQVNDTVACATKDSERTQFIFNAAEPQRKIVSFLQQSLNYKPVAARNVTTSKYFHYSLFFRGITIIEGTTITVIAVPDKEYSPPPPPPPSIFGLEQADCNGVLGKNRNSS